MTIRSNGVVWILSVAAFAGCMIGYVLRKVAEEQRRSEVKFVEEAIECLENEGGLFVA